MDTVSLNTSLRSGGHSVGTESPSLSMKSWGFTNDTDSVRSRHWNFFLAANFADVAKHYIPALCGHNGSRWLLWVSEVRVIEGKQEGVQVPFEGNTKLVPGEQQPFPVVTPHTQKVQPASSSTAPVPNKKRSDI